MTAANTELEFPMSNDIKQEMTTLGISRVCLNQFSGSEHNIPNGLVVHFIQTYSSPIECKYYSRHMKQTLYSELKPALIKSGYLDSKTYHRRLSYYFAKAWRDRIENEKKQDADKRTRYEKTRAAEISVINTEID